MAQWLGRRVSTMSSWRGMPKLVLEDLRSVAISSSIALRAWREICLVCVTYYMCARMWDEFNHFKNNSFVQSLVYEPPTCYFVVRSR